MKLSEKQLQIISEVAAREVLGKLHEEQEKEKQKKYDRRLRNIKLLLRNYRSFVEHSNETEFRISELDKELDLAILDSEELAIEAIKRSKKRTLAMVRFISSMIKVYGVMCEEDGTPEALRRFQSVYLMYISHDKKSAKEIATCHKTDVRTVYRDIDKSLETLSVLMFGIDGVKFK